MVANDHGADVIYSDLKLFSRLTGPETIKTVHWSARFSLQDPKAHFAEAMMFEDWAETIVNGRLDIPR